MIRKFFILLLAAGWLAGCSSTPRTDPSAAPPPPQTRSAGGYYLDDGPETNPPQNLHEVPDAVPRDEPLHRFANRPYRVMGVSYTPAKEREGFRQEGLASWYGKRFHGKKTASGEIYDMYGMTAAHPTLPIPSYAKVTSLDSGKSVIVRINDRGPFHSNRVIDLSYTAAFKLGLLKKGSGRVRVESIGPDTTAIQPAALAENRVGAEAPRNDDETEPGASQAAAAKPGHYVQLGAFGSLDNAQKLLSRVREALAISAELVQVALVDKLHRVSLGPFASRHEASVWARKSNAALGIASVMVTR